MKQSSRSYRILNLKMGLAWCGAEPGKMFVGSASKKPDAAICGTEIGRKFCKQCNKMQNAKNKKTLCLVSILQ